MGSYDFGGFLCFDCVILGFLPYKIKHLEGIVVLI